VSLVSAYRQGIIRHRRFYHPAQFID